MKVEHGASLITPARGNVLREDQEKRPGRASPSSGLRDTVQISEEARDLKAGRAEGAADLTEIVRSEDAALARVRERIGTGFYDLREVQLAMAEEILTLLGL